MPKLSFAMNKHGDRGRKALNWLVATTLAVGLIPIGALGTATKAYADESDGTRNAPIGDYLADNLDQSLAPKTEDNGLLTMLRSLVGVDRSALDLTEKAIVVKNTMADAASIAEGDGFAEVYASEEKISSSLLGQFESVAQLYDPGADSDYYVAFVDTAGMSGTARVIDWQAAEFNIMGELIDGVVYDSDTGIAYVPKSLYADDPAHIVQLQLLCAYDFDNATSEVDVRIQNDNGDVTAVAQATSVEVEPMDVTIDIPVATPETAGTIDVSEIEVFLNGSEDPMDPAGGENISYNGKTGVLTIAANASTVASVDVKINPRGFLAPERAYAVTADSMRAMKGMDGQEAVLTNLDPDKVSVGQAFTYTGFIQYFSADTTERRHQVLTTLWDSLYVGDIQEKLIDGAGGVIDSVWSPKDEGYDAVLGDSGHGGYDLVNTFDWPNANRAYGEYDEDGDPVYSNNNVINGVDWTGFPKTNDSYSRGWQGVAMCAHVGQNGWVEKVDNGDTSDFIGGITMRVLHKADDYLVLGFVLPTINTQTGAAVYKIKYESKGQVEIQKKSANESITANNFCYTFGGIKYGVYEDAGCTKLATTMTLNANGYAKSEEIKKGTYYVKEISTNGSYALSDVVATVEVPSGEVAKIAVTDEPLEDPDGLIVRKYDADSGQFLPSGDAKLALAEYTFEYVGGYAYSIEQFDQIKTSGTISRTWVMRTNDRGSTSLLMGDSSFEFADQSYNYKVSGDPFFYSLSGRVTLPIGTVRVHETKAPEGYNLSDRTYLVRIVPDPANPGWTKFEGDSELIQDGNTATDATKAAEQVARGGVTIYKRDAETKQDVPQPGTDWNGVAFEIINRSAAEVTYDGVKVPVGGVVTTIKTSASNGVATTGNEKLQYGTYGIREVATSDAYIMSDTDERTFEIREQGQMVVLDGDDAVYNQVKRGDFEFVKITERNPERLAGVPFLITNKASGEAHVVVTDSNGQAKTGAGWNAHTAATNGNDAAVDANGDGVFSDEEKAAVDTTKLDSYAGVWFGHDAEGNMAAQPNDSLGALPYGDYTVEELRVPANRLYELVNFDVSVRRHDASIDLGTITDMRPDVKIPWIGTSARDGADGDRLLVRDPEALVIDRAEYSNLDAGNMYRMVGTLMDKGTGEPVRDAEGNPITAEKVFVAEDVKGFVELAFGFDATTVQGDVVVFETLYKDGEDEPVAKHEDIDDYYQTVKIYEPAIGTTLVDGMDGDKTIVSDDLIKLVDTVTYKNLVPGKEHTVTGTLYKVSGEGESESVEPFCDAEGNPVVATTTFTPAEANGTVDVAFEFSGALIETDMSIVAYEQVLRLGAVVASHEDPKDPSQTVTVVEPEIGTMATDAKDGDHEIEAAKSVTINDVVAYKNLIPGREYELNLTVMQKTEAGATPLLNAGGKPYTATQAFTPETADGVAVVAVTIDSTELAGADLVMFEQLTLNGEIIATHEDPNDEDQTVHVTEPKIGTTATDKTDGDHRILASRSAVIVDEVAYSGLTPGEEYILKGVIMDKETGKPVIAGDREVRAEMRFTPNSPNGTVSLEFTFDASALGDKKLVVFEELYKNDEPVAEHKDINDEAQTVEVVTPLPSTGTNTPTPAGKSYAKTGVDTMVPMLTALALIVGGIAALVVARRRKQVDAIDAIEESVLNGDDK